MSKLLTQPDQERKAYRVPEIAKLYGVSTAFLWRKIKTGELPVRRLGKRVLILREEWEKYINQNGAAQGIIPDAKA